jgi:hypothetical protein
MSIHLPRAQQDMSSCEDRFTYLNAELNSRFVGADASKLNFKRTDLLAQTWLYVADGHGGRVRDVLDCRFGNRSALKHAERDVEAVQKNRRD